MCHNLWVGLTSFEPTLVSMVISAKAMGPDICANPIIACAAIPPPKIFDTHRIKVSHSVGFGGIFYHPFLLRKLAGTIHSVAS